MARHRNDIGDFLEESAKALQEFLVKPRPRMADDETFDEVGAIILGKPLPREASSWEPRDVRDAADKLREKAEKKLFKLAKSWGLAGSIPRFNGQYETDLLVASNDAVFREQFGDNVVEIDGDNWVVFPLHDAEDPEEPSSTASNLQEVLDGYEEYPILDEEDHSRREMEASFENVRDIARPMVDGEISDEIAGQVVEWIYENDEGQMESRDGAGAYPDEHVVREALHELKHLSAELEAEYYPTDFIEEEHHVGPVIVKLRIGTMDVEDVAGSRTGGYSRRFSATMIVPVRNSDRGRGKVVYAIPDMSLKKKHWGNSQWLTAYIVASAAKPIEGYWDKRDPMLSDALMEATAEYVWDEKVENGYGSVVAYVLVDTDPVEEGEEPTGGVEIQILKHELGKIKMDLTEVKKNPAPPSKIKKSAEAAKEKHKNEQEQKAILDAWIEDDEWDAPNLGPWTYRGFVFRLTPSSKGFSFQIDDHPEQVFRHTASFDDVFAWVDRQVAARKNRRPR